MNSTVMILITAVISVGITSGVALYAVSLNDQQTDVLQIMPPPPEPEAVYVYDPSFDFFKGTQEIQRISSQQELEDVINASALLRGGYHDEWFSSSARLMVEKSTITDFDMNLPSIAQVDYASSSTSPAKVQADAYSTTNVQVKNVDEPDYLKNDSKYVYIVSGSTLSIIDAYPAETAELVLKVALDVESRYIENMFLNNDRLVIFYNGERYDDIIPQYGFVPHRSFSSVTHALIIDVSDKENPTIIQDYSIDGHFKDARMIGDYAYFVTNSYVDYQHPRLPMVMTDDNTVPVVTPDAFYFDNVEEFSNFTTLTAINIFEDDVISSETFLMGHTGTFYVSEDNFYLTYQRQQHNMFGFYEGSLPRDRFFDVVVPLLPVDVRDEIEAIQNDASTDTSARQQWMRISELMEEKYGEMSDNDRKKMFAEIREALTKYDLRVQEDVRRTIIHKISIDEENIEYVAKGSVPGQLLNQFSMDQRGDRFRVATTVVYYTPFEGTFRTNAVYVLDDQLDVVGQLDGIAPNESIFSSRFIGDRLYLVTFKQIDPFFVIDLSTDTPKILGELKIPGFSNYLHPFDEDHIIGLGKDTKESQGRVQQLGIKIALFNVADVHNPTVADEVIIGDISTHSEALRNHKAFFFDKQRNVLSIPISGSVNALNESLPPSFKKIVPSHGDNDGRWNGFYIFDMDGSAAGISLKGTIDHSTDDGGGRHWYDTTNSRTFYIGDVLYTASEIYLKMNSFDDLEHEINSIKLANTGKFINFLEDGN